MTNDNVIPLSKPEQTNLLQEVLKRGAQALLAKAIEAEVSALLEAHSSLKTDDGKQAVVRNGNLPERSIQTGLGDIKVKVPKVRDRSGNGIKFNSKLVPPYLKRTKKMEAFLPWLYLKGISTGDFKDTLAGLLDDSVQGLSSDTICRLKKEWEKEFTNWQRRKISKKYTYIWDGVYSQVRMDDKLCLLVMIGADEFGNKEILAVEDGFRESEQSWTDVINDLMARGMQIPELLIGDGALGLWKAASKIWPSTVSQRCWVHKTANVLSKVPKSVQPKLKEALHDIWQAETREDAYEAFDACLSRFELKYSKAMNCLSKDKDILLAFYDFPAEHWQHIRTTNPIESVFATVRLRTTKTKNCGSRKTTLTMAFKLMQAASKNWRKLKGHKRCAEVIQGVRFVNGEPENEDQRQMAL